MVDIEKVIKGLQAHVKGCGRRSNYCDIMECPYRIGDEFCDIKQMCIDALDLLKEQEHKDKMFHALEDDWKRLKELLKEQEVVVRCDDCKYWYFADNRIPCEQENVCGRNGIVVTPDWFCADGERRTDDA